jgi:hypothetical protein
MGNSLFLDFVEPESAWKFALKAPLGGANVTVV